MVASIHVGSVPTSEACSRVYPFRLNELFSADIIVRASAVKYIVTPDSKTITGVPESTVEFKIEETIWGGDAPASIVLHGYLTDKDDFNDVPLPYRFVRPGGRGGSCFANSYKKGAQFLLFLKKSPSSHMTNTGYTTNISALGPTNEQLRGVDDPWVKWIKAYLSPCAKQNARDTDFGMMSKTEMEAVAGGQTSDLEKYRLAKCYLTKYGTSSNDTKKYMQVVNSYETIPVMK